jgi:hypothetical protein
MPKGRKVAGKKKPAARGRRAAKPTKEEAVETSHGAQLLLSNLPSDKDATFAYETLLHLMAKARSASGKVGDHKKKMKEMGMNVQAFTETMKLERLDPEDLAAQLMEMRRLAKLRGLPVQIDLYEAKYGTVEEQAYAEGYGDGKNGRNANLKRWGEGTKGYDEYMRGWNAGQKDMVMKGTDTSDGDGDWHEDDEHEEEE